MLVFLVVGRGSPGLEHVNRHCLASLRCDDEAHVIQIVSRYIRLHSFSEGG